MKRLLPIACALLLSTAGLLLNSTKAHAFSGEDPVFGHPWYHEQITREAAKGANFTFNSQKDAPDLPKGSIPAEIEAMMKDDPRRSNDGAAEALAWHADYLDSYLYSPIWWAAAGKGKALPAAVEAVFKRYKVSRAVETELKNMHFDDLFSTDKVNYMWRRYASGTFAGLLWASEQNGGEGDVFAAQHILGASMHAIEDFYSHSSWIDKPERRTKTYFEYPLASRNADNLFTGAYEHDHQLGVKSHGKWIPSNFIWSQPGIKQLMEAACDPISPFSNSPECEAWKEVQKGTSMHPNIGGVTLPDSIMVYTPAGIALDNKWVAGESVKQRGIDMEGLDAFNSAHTLAVRQGTQWLTNLEAAMKTAHKEEFWKKVKSTPSSDEQRQAPFESYGQFPFLFMAYGEYPPTKVAGSDEWYLRVKLHTASEANAGTDSDIKVRVNGKDHLLDYLPKAGPVMAYNDFEAGDNDSYYIGPFDSFPNSIELVNDAADGKDLLDAAGRDFSAAVQDTVQSVGDLLLNVVGGHADKVAVNKQLWMPGELANMPMRGNGQGFNIPLNGGDEGNYRANGTIFKVGEDESNYEFEVHIDSLSCIKESKFDRLSSEDEPFLLCALNPLPGDQQTWLSPVYQKVDTGETVNVAHGFARVSVPKSSGMLNLALTLMESDDEKQSAREELLAKFAGTYEDKLEESRHAFSRALATTIAAEWKLADIEVVAWTRNGTVREGTVLRQNVNRWIKPKKPVPFALDANAVFNSGVTIDQLLPDLSSGAQQPTPTNPTPTDPTPTNPVPPNPTTPSYDLTTWVDEWDTTYGRVKLALNNGVLTGRLYIIDEFTRLEKESDRLELRAGDAPGKLVGTATYTGVSTQVALTMNADGNSFSATSTSANNLTDKWSGKRRRVTPPTPPVPTPTPKPGGPVVTPPGTPTNPIPTNPVPTNPVPTNPVPTNPIPTNPGPGTGTNIGGDFLPLKGFAARVDRVAPNVAGDKLEVFLTLKNRKSAVNTINGSMIRAVATDADGVGFMDSVAFYRPEGEPELMAGNREVNVDGELKVRLLITIPEGTSQLKTLTLWETTSPGQTVNISSVSFPGVRPAANLAAMGLSNGTNEFKPCGESLDVRFDGFRKSRSGFYEAFFTFKNTTDTGLRADVLDFNSSSLEVFTHGADGAKQRYDTLMRPNGEKAIWIPIHYAILSGGEAHVRYTFSSKNDVPKPVKVTVGDRISKTTVEWAVTVP